MKLLLALCLVCHGFFIHNRGTLLALDSNASTESWTLEKTVQTVIQLNPELKSMRENLALALLEEPALLANTDPFLFGKVQKSEDWSPTPVPQILGRRSIEEQLSFGVGQKWLTGTQVQFTLQGNRYDSDALFRSFNPTYSDRVQFELRQPLLKNFWGRPDKALRQKARKNVLIAKTKIDQAMQELAVRVVDAYLELLYSQQDFTIKQESIKDLYTLLKRQQEKQSYGIAEETDILQTKAAIQLKEVEIRIAETLVKVSRQNLFALMSHPEPDPPIRFQPIELQERKSYGFEALLNQAQKDRFDLLAAQAQIESLEAELRSVQLSSLPSIDFVSKMALNSLSSSFSGASGDVSARGKPYYLLGVELQIPLFRKMEKVEIKSVEAKLRQAKELLLAVQNRIWQEVKNHWELYRLAVEKSNAWTEVVKIQKAKYEEEKKNFQKGRSNTDTLIRFQSEVYQSQSQRVRAQLDEVKSEILLNLFAGGMRKMFPTPE